MKVIITSEEVEKIIEKSLVAELERRSILIADEIAEELKKDKYRGKTFVVYIDEKYWKK